MVDNRAVDRDIGLREPRDISHEGLQAGQAISDIRVVLYERLGKVTVGRARIAVAQNRNHSLSRRGAEVAALRFIRHPRIPQAVEHDLPSDRRASQRNSNRSRPDGSENGETLGLSASELVALLAGWRYPSVLNAEPRPRGQGRGRAARTGRVPGRAARCRSD